MANIIRVEDQENSVVVGDNFTTMLGNLSFLDENELETLRNESIDIISKCTHRSKSDSFQTGLVIGYVQSGKTLSFTTVIALASDNDFSIVIVLAGTKTNLLTQTTSRLRKDLHSVDNRVFKIIENPEDSESDYIARTLTSKKKKILVITILKHNKRIDRLSNVLRNPTVKEALGSSPVLIIDDEADQASLNTRASSNARKNQTEESSTFAAIHNLRSVIRNHTFLQYTATPQGPLLIDLISSLSPEFYCVISPGKKYTGGSYFFSESQEYSNIEIIPNDQVYHHNNNPLNSPPSSLRQALVDFFISSTLILDHLDTKQILGDDQLLSMMIHPSHRIDGITLFHGWCRGFIEGWQKTLELHPSDSQYIDLKNEVAQRLPYFTTQANLDLTFEDLAEDLYERLLETRVHRVTGEDLDIDWSISSSHIIVGGGKLDRGYTVKGLLTTYMPRTTTSTSNADTIQQRCRFFGYKLDFIPYCKIYLPDSSIQEYISYVDHEEYLRTILKETDPSQFSRHFLLDARLRPTRTSILSSRLNRTTLRGAKPTTAFAEESANQELVREFCSNYNFEASPFNGTTDDRIHQFAEISIIEAIDFLLNFKMTLIEDLELKSMIIEYLLYVMDNDDIAHCHLYKMAHEKEYRERSVNDIGRINQLFSGRSTKGNDTYVGDRYLQHEDFLSIQIHTVKLTKENSELDGRIIKTLGFVFPTNTITFQGVE